jgi:hypothetical protein
MNEDRSRLVAIELEMGPDGTFRAPPPAPFSSKVLRVALVIAALATAGAFAFLALWLAMTLIPIAIGAALVAYGMFRYRVWKAGGSVGGQNFPFRR